MRGRFVGWHVCIPSAGSEQPALPIHLDSVGPAAILPVVDQFSGPGINTAVRPKRETPQLSSTADRVVIVISHIQVFVSLGDEYAIGPLDFTSDDASHLPWCINPVNALDEFATLVAHFHRVSLAI